MNFCKDCDFSTDKTIYAKCTHPRSSYIVGHVDYLVSGNEKSHTDNYFCSTMRQHDFRSKDDNCPGFMARTKLACQWWKFWKWFSE